MEEIKFTPKQWVLVRDASDKKWKLDIFSHIDRDFKIYPFICMGRASAQCIPYEGNEELIGTTNFPIIHNKPKDGDFVVSGWENNGCKCQWIAIVKGRYEDDFYATYYGLYTINNGSDKRGSWLDEYCDSQSYTRNATEEEKQQLINALHKEGKDWDAENKKVVDWEWIPEDGESVYYPFYICGEFFPGKFTWIKDNINCMNFLRKRLVKRKNEECQELCDKLNNAIQNIK